MDPEFKGMLLRVVLVGGTVGLIGVVALIVAFRAVMREGDEPGNFRPAILGGILIVFILLSCAVLFMVSRG